MLSRNEILQTIDMIDQQHLDIRTITMGISLLCLLPTAIRWKPAGRSMTRSAATPNVWCPPARQIELEFGIPIVNKRISVTPMALVAAASDDTRITSPSPRRMDRAAKTCGVNFIGGYSALVQKGYDRWRSEAHRLHSGSPGRAPSTSAPLSMWVPPERASTWTPCG